jgi:integrase
LRLGDTKTGFSIRALPEPARAILAGLERQGGFVLPARSRTDKSYASVFPKAWLRIVGDTYSPHGLRHAYASSAHELNFSELTIKALLGHARVGVTSGYVARVEGLLLASANDVARYVWRSMTGEAGKVVQLSGARPHVQ